MHASMATRAYYLKNRKARLHYQREYYQTNKGRIARKREVAEAVDPELRERRRKYQRAYYRKNRARILIIRRKQYAHNKSAQMK
jgi:tryptophanyl-tRNA synthetase